MSESLRKNTEDNPMAEQWEDLASQTASDERGDAVTDAKKTFYTTHADYMQDRATDEDRNKAKGELNRAREDRDYYRSMSEKEALEIAEKFGNVESIDSKHRESVRGSDGDRDISEDVYPQLEGESDYDYEARINNMRAETMRDIMGDAVTDAKKTFYTTHADYMQDRATDEDRNKAKKKLDLTKSLHEKGKL